MKFNLNQKRFVTIRNEKGLSSDETIFDYVQSGKVITGSYQGGAILEGRIVGKQSDENRIELLFQCLTKEGELKAGESKGIVSQTKDGRLRLQFDWNWLNGDRSTGQSEYVELIE